MPKRRRVAVAVLEVMWDWRGHTSGAGYRQAPTHFIINPENHTGRRLYDWLGPQGEFYDHLWVTNACKDLVSSAKGKGTPDPVWLERNIKRLLPFDLLLVCGRVAQQTYHPGWVPPETRILEVPHPAARQWTKRDLSFVRRVVRYGNHSLDLKFCDGRLKATHIIPF